MVRPTSGKIVRILAKGNIPPIGCALIHWSSTAFCTEEKPPKRIKKKKTAEEEEVVVGGESENVLPTAPLSKRQKKKQKKLLNMTKSKDKEVEKTNAYLDKWNSNRDEWKYEKLRQIFLQKHIFDVNVIDDEHCDIAIKYLSTSKVLY